MRGVTCLIFPAFTGTSCAVWTLQPHGPCAQSASAPGGVSEKGTLQGGEASMVRPGGAWGGAGREELCVVCAH